jgi:hypothetical protein
MIITSRKNGHMGIYRLQVCKYTLGDSWRLQGWIIIVTAMFLERGQKEAGAWTYRQKFIEHKKKAWRPL